MDNHILLKELGFHVREEEYYEINYIKKVNNIKYHIIFNEISGKWILISGQLRLILSNKELNIFLKKEFRSLIRDKILLDILKKEVN